MSVSRARRLLLPPPVPRACPRDPNTQVGAAPRHSPAHLPKAGATLGRAGPREQVSNLHTEVHKKAFLQGPPTQESDSASGSKTSLSELRAAASAVPGAARCGASRARPRAPGDPHWLLPVRGRRPAVQDSREGPHATRGRWGPEGRVGATPATAPGGPSKPKPRRSPVSPGPPGCPPQPAGWSPCPCLASGFSASPCPGPQPC